jgi:hypothetical protein
MKKDQVRERPFAMRLSRASIPPGPCRLVVPLLLALALGACAGASGSARYDPFRCDRNGDESQRRSC